MNPQQPVNNQQYTTPSESSNQPVPPRTPKGKKTGVIIAVVVALVVILGAIAFMAFGANKKENNNTKPTDTSNTNSGNNTASSDKFKTYDVTDKIAGKTYSVSFYKDATVSEKNGRTYLTSGESGSQYSIYLSVVMEPAIDCGETPSTTMRLNGKSTNVCYESNNMRYAGHVTVQNSTIRLSLAGQKAINMEDAKAILESVVFK